MGGATTLAKPTSGGGAPNHNLLAQVYRALRVIYLPLGLLTGLLLGLVGTWMLAKPVGASTAPQEAWIAWGIMLAGSTIGFCNLVYATYLQGTNRVALLRRWETLGHVGSGLTMILVLYAGAGLIALAIAAQAWTILIVFRDAWLAHRTEPETFRVLRNLPLGIGALPDIWRNAWRSGLGVLLNAGVVRISAGVVAQFASAPALAAYLLAFNVLDRINQFSMAPFYSKLPTLGALYSGGRWDDLWTRAKRGMVLTLGVFLVSGVGGAIGLWWFLDRIDSDTPFIGFGFWGLLLLAMLVHRYGAMHLQVYTLSNKVIWHIIDGIAGGVYLVVFFGLLQVVGVYAVPFALLVAYSMFYTVFALRKAIPFIRQLRTGASHAA